MGSFFAKTRNYKTILESYLFDDKIDSKLYENLIKITDNNLDSLKEYYKVKDD